MSVGLRPLPPGFDALVYIPSIGLGPLTRQYLSGLEYFQERNYYIFSELKNPGVHVICVVSNAMQNALSDAHIDLLRRVLNLSSDSLSRLHFVKVDQSPQVSLSTALLADAESCEKLKSLIKGRRAILDFWTVGEEEIALTKVLDLPHIGMPAGLIGADSKMKAKSLFRRAGVKTPRDYGVFFDLESLWEHTKAGTFPESATLLLKLNHEEGGNGIARFQSCAEISTPDAFRRAITIDKPFIGLSEFEREMGRQGALVETFVSEELVASPSAKMQIDEAGNVRPLATHDQVLRNSMYLGCRFPADVAYRKRVGDAALRIGRECARDGWRGIVSVDFLLTRSSGELGDATTLWAIEINARKGATTHPYFWARTLTGATYDPAEGILKVDGKPVTYQSSEYIASPILNNVAGSEVLRMIEDAGLAYDPQSKEGILTHMLSCAQSHEKIGATAIGPSPVRTGQLLQEIEDLFKEKMAESGRDQAHVAI